MPVTGQMDLISLGWSEDRSFPSSESLDALRAKFSGGPRQSAPEAPPVIEVSPSPSCCSTADQEVPYTTISDIRQKPPNIPEVIRLSDFGTGAVAAPTDEHIQVESKELPSVVTTQMQQNSGGTGTAIVSPSAPVSVPDWILTESVPVTVDVSLPDSEAKQSHTEKHEAPSWLLDPISPTTGLAIDRLRQRAEKSREVIDETQSILDEIDGAKQPEEQPPPLLRAQYPLPEQNSLSPDVQRFLRGAPAPVRQKIEALVEPTPPLTSLSHEFSALDDPSSMMPDCLEPIPAPLPAWTEQQSALAAGPTSFTVGAKPAPRPKPSEVHLEQKQVARELAAAPAQEPQMPSVSPLETVAIGAQPRGSRQSVPVMHQYYSQTVELARDQGLLVERPAPATGAAGRLFSPVTASRLAAAPAGTRPLGSTQYMERQFAIQSSECLDRARREAALEHMRRRTTLLPDPAPVRRGVAPPELASPSTGFPQRNRVLEANMQLVAEAQNVLRANGGRTCPFSCASNAVYFRPAVALSEVPSPSDPLASVADREERVTLVNHSHRQPLLVHVAAPGTRRRGTPFYITHTSFVMQPQRAVRLPVHFSPPCPGVFDGSLVLRVYPSGVTSGGWTVSVRLQGEGLRRSVL